MRWGQPDPYTFTGPLSDIGVTCAKRPSANLTKYTTLQCALHPRSLVAERCFLESPDYGDCEAVTGASANRFVIQ